VQTILKNKVLIRLSEIISSHENEILAANRQDLNAFPDMDASTKDRLKVDEKKIVGMIQSLRDVAELPDPEGKILYGYTRPDGLHIENRSVPFGTILIIYESRPDVTIEAAATAFKAGNRILLKGGKESLNTNMLLTQLWQQALTENGIDQNFVQYLNLSHAETQQLIKDNPYRVDLIIPRGGEKLIAFVKENASAPVIVSGRGNNFLFIDKNSDFEMAIRIILNGKQRISVCNALDKVLIDENIPDLEQKVHRLTDELLHKNIEIVGDEKINSLDSRIKKNDDSHILSEEFLAAKIYLSIVPDIEAAVNIINTYSGGHSATIVTNDDANADLFMQQVDCAAVYRNASTRFTDGGQFGVGAEIAISTQKLHFRGPLGAQELVTNKWFVYGNGHIRE
jgi:glutamate-5-semialdehyde dehydrogenase